MAKPLPKEDLRNIPGVGKDMEQHFRTLGICTVSDLIGTDPEQLYQLDCMQQGVTVDRCVLYVYRMAVYYAEHKIHDPALLKWWNWKDAQ